jgi:dynein heavy chain
MLTKNKPIFKVNANIVNLEVVLQPSANEIYIIILRHVKDLMERMKAFPRWMIGTCIECAPIKDDTTIEFIIFSFFEDMMGVQVLINIFKIF